LADDPSHQPPRSDVGVDVDIKAEAEAAVGDFVPPHPEEWGSWPDDPSQWPDEEEWV
jgi:hypothetical protein